VANEQTSTGIKFKVLLGTTEVPDADFTSFVVEKDLNQPDMAVITLRNQDHRNSEWDQGQDVEVKTSDSNTSIFKGTIVGVEPIYRGDGENRVVIRAYGPLHLLLRGKKSRTFQKQSDAKIVQTIAGEYGLSPKCGTKVNITHNHVYQHNQTDLEFLRTRAARLGYSVWVEGTTLHFDKPDTSASANIKFEMAKEAIAGHHLKSFAPRLSSSGIVKKVTVQGWDPEKKDKIIGEATAASSKLGSTDAAAALGSPFKKEAMTKTFVVDHPIFSPEEAKAIAEAKLAELMLSYITGEAEAFGNPEYKPGVVVQITINPDKKDDRFNGSYLVTGCTHRFTTGGGAGKADGYMTVLRVSRDAQKPAS
jgi:phage protein D